MDRDRLARRGNGSRGTPSFPSRRLGALDWTIRLRKNPTASESVRPKANKRLIALLAGVSMAGPLAMQIYLPALPVVREAFGVSVALAQLSLSISVLALAPAVLIYGPLSDRYGRRPVLVAGLIVFLLGSVMCAASPNIWWLIAGRTIQAVGGASGLVVARAIVTDLYATEQVARMFATLTMVMIVGPTVAPLLGGFLTDQLGWRSVFVVVSVFGACLAWLTYSTLEDTGRSTGGSGLQGIVQGFGRLAGRPVFFAYALQTSFSLAVYYTFISAAPYIMVNILGRPPTEYGTYFLLLSFGYFIGNLVTARISARVGGDRMILAGAVIAAGFACVALFLALTLDWSPIVFFGPMTVLAFSFGLSAPNSHAGAMRVVPDASGTASSVVGFLQQALGAVVIQSIGFLLKDTPYPMLVFMLVGSVLSLLCISAAIGYKRRQNL